MAFLSAGVMAEMSMLASFQTLALAMLSVAVNAVLVASPIPNRRMLPVAPLLTRTKRKFWAERSSAAAGVRPSTLFTLIVMKDVLSIACVLSMLWPRRKSHLLEAPPCTLVVWSRLMATNSGVP